MTNFLVAIFCLSPQCEGVLRDCRGVSIASFSWSMSRCSMNYAKLSGIYHGLLIAKQCGFQQVIVEGDCLSAIKIIIIIDRVSF